MQLLQCAAEKHRQVQLPELCLIYQDGQPSKFLLPHSIPINLGFCAKILRAVMRLYVTVDKINLFYKWIRYLSGRTRVGWPRVHVTAAASGSAGKPASGCAAVPPGSAAAPAAAAVVAFSSRVCVPVAGARYWSRRREPPLYQSLPFGSGLGKVNCYLWLMATVAGTCARFNVG